MIISGNLRLESEAAGAADMLRRVAAMCEELSSLGADVQVAVEMNGGTPCSMSNAISTPITALMELPGHAVHGTLKGAGLMLSPQAEGSLRGGQVNGGSVLPVSTNGSVPAGMAATTTPTAPAASSAADESPAVERMQGRRLSRRQQVAAMSTAEKAAAVIADIKRLASDEGQAPSKLKFMQRSQAPLQALLKQGDYTWSGLVTAAGYQVAPKGKRPAKGGMSSNEAATFRDEAAGS